MNCVSKFLCTIMTFDMLVSSLCLFFLSTYMGSTRGKFSIIVLCKLLAMGNCLNGSNISSSNKETVTSLPIDTIFKFPSPLPTWPTDGGFGSGEIDLGGLLVRQLSSFNKVWETYDGGADNLGATFFEPSSIPDGFSMLGTYAQSNNQPLFGWILVASDQSGDILKPPTDYTLVWTNGQTTAAYFWLPMPPDGYKAVGHVVTTSPDKPSLDKIRCVRSDFTEESEKDQWIWAQGTAEIANGTNVYGLRPKDRGITAQSLSVGSFLIQNTTSSNDQLLLACLKNNHYDLSRMFYVSPMPTLSQIQTLLETYSPFIYFHPKEIYLPASLDWFFSNGALLYQKGNESNPVPIAENGSNLPLGGPNNDTYWLDLPIDNDAKEKVKKGDLQSAEVYLNAKPMYGATFTDIQIWLFYPFNGHATAKLGIINEIKLGKIGEHVGDWEHLTLRISNFDGVLYRVYYSEHSGGRWVDSSMLEFQNGNKFVVYSSLNGHASYYQSGINLQGNADVGLRNDCDKSDMVMDTGANYTLVRAEGVVMPPWVYYDQQWGPNITYNIGDEVKEVEKFLFGSLKKDFEKLVNSLPAEVFGEEGPTGPMMKDNWIGDEKN